VQIDHLRSWLAVIESGSFHAAGRRLGIAQPTVSQHVRKLEARLGASLLDRAGCTPTSAGQLLRPCAEALIRLEARTLASVRGHSLSVGAGGNVGIYLLLPHVFRFEQRHAPTRVELHIEPNPRVLQRLVEGQLDLGVLEWWPTGDQQPPGLVAIPWRRHRLVVIFPPGHRWARQRSVPPQELARETLLGGEPGTGTGRLLAEALVGLQGDGGVTVRKLGSTEAVKRAVAAGLGVSLVLEPTVADEVKAGTLLARPLRGRALSKTLHIAHAAALPAQAPARALAALLLQGAGGGGRGADAPGRPGPLSAPGAAVRR
jgi:LysR family transcriptional regulator, low CO2-responsive transcriptional regulator